MIPQAPKATSPSASRSRVLKSSQRMLRALEVQSLEAAVQLPAPASNTSPIDGRQTAVNRNRGNDSVFNSSLYSITTPRPGFTTRMEIEDISSAKFEHRPDNNLFYEEDKDNEHVEDTSWFISKKEIVAYLKKFEDDKYKKNYGNPGKAQEGRKHRGWTAVKKHSNPMCELDIENVMRTTIAEESTVKVKTSSSLVLNTENFLSRPKPRMPGPVLTYKQLSALYDSKPTRSDTSLSPTRNISPKQGSKPRVNRGKTPKTAPMTPSTPSSTIVKRGGFRTKKTMIEFTDAYVEHIQLIKSSLSTGLIIPIFSLYFDVDDNTLQSFYDDLDPSSSFSHIKAQNLSMISELRKILLMQTVGDDAALVILQQKSAGGLRVLRQRQRELEQTLILRCLDFLSVGEISILFEVSKPWAAVAYLKLYMTEEKTISPMVADFYVQYCKGISTGTLSPPMYSPSVTFSITKFVSPKMITMFLKQYIDGFHGAYLAVHNKAVQRQSSTVVGTDRKHSDHSVRATNVYYTGLSHIRPFPFLNYIFLDLQELSCTANPFHTLRKLNLTSVVIDEDAVREFSLLQSLECITLHFVKMRTVGLYATCFHCKSEGFKLSNMLLCKNCFSSAYPYCTSKCRKNDGLNHAKECPATQKDFIAYSPDAKFRKLSTPKAMTHETYFEEDTEVSSRQIGTTKKIISATQSNKNRCSWIDGHFLSYLFRNLSQTVTTVSLTYVLPKSVDSEEDFEKSFRNSQLFENLPKLTTLHVREVHEALLTKPEDPEVEKIHRNALRRWNAVRAFSHKNLFEIAINCRGNL